MITIVTGPPAAGKSTYVQENAADGDITIDFDALAQTFGSTTSHDAPADVKTVTFAARAAAIETVLAGLNTDAWIIHTQPTDEQLASYEEAGAEVVTVDPGMDQVLAQAEADGRPEWTEQAIRDWYEREKSAPPVASTKTTNQKGGPAMAVVHKTFAAKVTPAAKDSGDPEGTFTALVSVFGNKDHGGDVVEAGAFTKTLHEWALKERPVPLVWAHQFHDVDNFLGQIISIEETDEGLLIKAQLDLDHPKAARVYSLMKRGLIVEFSWSGLVREYEWLEDDEDDWWPGMKILDVDLWEAGPCFKGANPDTELLSIKSDGRVDGRLLKAKAGRVLSQQNLDSLTAARDAITKVIDAAVPAPEDDEGQDGEEAAAAAAADAEESATKTTAPTGAGKHSQALLELITTTNL